MFCILTERVYRVAVHPQGKFDARHTNVTRWTVSGPFRSRKMVEAAARAAMGTHTCLLVQIHDAESIAAIRLLRYTNGQIQPIGSHSGPEGAYQRAAIEARKLLGVPEEAGWQEPVEVPAP